jgi:hypothetical protein
MTALKLFHVSRPTTVLSVALLAATAVIGSTINTMSYLDSISSPCLKSLYDSEV